MCIHIKGQKKRIKDKNSNNNNKINGKKENEK